MALSSLGIPKDLIPKLRNLPRDLFNIQQNIDPGVAPGIQRLNMVSEQYGYGVDLVITNDSAAPGNATVIIDKSKTMNVIPGQTITLDNILYANIEVLRAGAAAIDVDLYFAGFSLNLLQLIYGKPINPMLK